MGPKFKSCPTLKIKTDCCFDLMIMNNHYGADAKGFKFYCNLYLSKFIPLVVLNACLNLCQNERSLFLYIWVKYRLLYKIC